MDGVFYPYGRIYTGRSGDQALVAELAEMLDDQLVQAQFEVEMEFLCVGHGP